MTEPLTPEERITALAEKFFLEGRCPKFLLLWGKPVGCGEGAGHEGNHRYNEAISRADLS